MSKITLSRFESAASAIVRRVSKTGESVTITHRGKALVRILPAQPETADQSGFKQAAATLDLDEAMLDDSELWDGDEANRTWDVLNSAIARDLASTLQPAPKPQTQRSRRKS